MCIVLSITSIEKHETARGLRVADKGFVNTAVIQSEITYIDGNAGGARSRTSNSTKMYTVQCSPDSSPSYHMRLGPIFVQIPDVKSKTGPRRRMSDRMSICRYSIALDDLFDRHDPVHPHSNEQ